MAASTPEGRTVVVDGTDVHLYDVGQGEAVLCLHGGAPGATGWNNLGQNVEALSQQFRVVVVDLPGFGGSGLLPVEGANHRDMALLYRALLDELGIATVHVLGLATGGSIAMELALLDPERVASLILVNSAGSVSLGTPGATEGVRAILSYYEGDGPSLEKMRRYLELAVHDQSVLTAAFVQDRFDASLRQQGREGRGRAPEVPLWARMTGITAPTLVVWGRENRVQPVDCAWYLMRQIPDAEVHVFPQAGLMVPVEKQGEFEALAIGFLTRHARHAHASGR